jgi:hypothetical protein
MFFAFSCIGLTANTLFLKHPEKYRLGSKKTAEKSN